MNIIRPASSKDLELTRHKLDCVTVPTILDLTDVKVVTSEVISVLIMRKDLIHIVNPSPQTRTVLKILRVDSLLKIYDSVDQVI